MVVTVHILSQDCLELFLHNCTVMYLGCGLSVPYTLVILLNCIHIPEYLMVTCMWCIFVALFQHISFIMVTVQRLMLFFVALDSHVKKNWHLFKTDKV